MMQLQEQVKDELIARFGNNRWADKRLDCSDIIEFAREHEDDHHQWSDFLKNLALRCAGRYFTSDKQWGKLMNYMGISRKLNHRSVKLKDIIAQRSIIELRWPEIIALNESSRLASSVETLLLELELNLNRKCTLNVPTDLSKLGENIAQSRGFIMNHCQRLIRTLRIELRNRLVASDERCETWILQLDRLELAVEKLAKLLDDLLELQTKLADLAPLISASKLEYPNNRASSGLCGEIDSCKRQFVQVWSFNCQSLLPGLQRRIIRGRQSRDNTEHDLLLIKLLSQSNEFVDRVFDQHLHDALGKLEDCKLRLNHIMQTLRLEFGRFYFISDLELLSLISIDVKLVSDSSRNPEYSELIKKLFNNSFCSCVVVQNELIGVKNQVGETILLDGDPIPLDRHNVVYNLELVRVLDELCRRLRRTLRSTLWLHVHKPFEHLYEQSVPIQVAYITQQLEFCQKVETSLDGSAQGLRSLIEQYERRFKSLVDCKQLDQDACLKKSALLSSTVHFISTLKDLDSHKVVYRSDWNWQKQIRYYRTAESDLEVKIGYATYLYRFNLLPVETTTNNSGDSKFKRLINTPLNQRCQLVASEAICNLKLGAQPYGPAGSGKTETVKALGFSLGCQVVVHNCDQTNDTESLQRLLFGLAHVGLWGCFDEFNRLNESVLSATSSTLELIQVALREAKTSIAIGDGEYRPISQDTSFFITLNPGDGCKYRGRRRLPANLRALFIPVSMSRVEIAKIASESLLVIVGELGFVTDKHPILSDHCFQLATKLSLWLEKVSQSLNCWCEWDLRLVVAIFKRLRLLATGHKLNLDELESIIVRSIMVEVEPRLSQSDKLREDFVLSLQEFFTWNLGEQISHTTYQVQQLVKEQLETHTGVILLKPASFSMSSFYELFEDPKIAWLCLNPRASRCERFLGHYEPASKQFSDGIFTSVVRQAITKLSQERLTQVCIFLDGPMDPDWVEALNSVLDDNQTLTLVSGERINFSLSQDKAIKLVFVTEDLSFCSPATLSRLGLVHVCQDMSAKRAHFKKLDELTEGIMSDQSGNLLVIVGSTSDAKKVSIIRSSKRQLHYNCNRYTNADHLTDVLDMAEEGDLIILTSIGNIRDDFEGWKVKSSLELLDYVTTYSSYFRSDNSIRKLKCKFVVLVEDSATLGAKLISKAMFIQSNEKAEECHDRLDMNVENVKSLANESNLVEIMLADNMEQVKQIILETSGENELMLFQNSNSAFESLRKLEQLLNQKNGIEVSSKTRTLFLLDSIELDLLEDELQASFWHNIEMFKMKNLQSVKIVLLLDKLGANQRHNLQMIGRVTHLEDSNPRDTQTLLKERLGESLDKNHLDELTILLRLVEPYLVDVFDKNLNSFLVLLCRVTSQFQSSTKDELLMLTRGLDCLQAFDTKLDHVNQVRSDDETRLKNKRDQVELLLNEVNQSIYSASEKKKQLAALRSEQTKKSEEIEAKRNVILESASKVSKKVEESGARIGESLRPEAINEIRTLRAPTKTIREILEVLFTFLGVEDTSWGSIKTHLAKISLRDELTNYDFRKKLTSSLLSRVEYQMSVKGESFQEQQASRASTAIMPIVSWIKAASEYGRVLLKLEPLESELKELEFSLEKLQSEAHDLELEQKQVEDRLETDKRKLDRLRYDLAQFEESLDENSRKLFRAKEARRNCEHQVKRWRSRLEELRAQADNLEPIKACLLASCLPFIDSESLDQLCRLINFLDETEPKLLVRSLATSCLVDLDMSVEIKKPKQVLQLITAKLCLMTEDRQPFFQLQQDTNPDQVLEVFRYLSILTNSDDDLCLVELDSDSEAMRKVELALKLNKLVVAMLSDETKSGSILELVRLAKSSEHIILVGNLRHDHRQALSGRLKFLELDTENFLSEESISSSISDYLSAKFDIELNRSVAQVSGELKIHNEQLSKLEAKLLEQLARLGSRSSGDLDPEESTLDVLDGLHKLNETLTANIGRKKLELNKFTERQGRFVKFAREAAGFYKSHLAGLGKLDSYYHISLGRYQDMLAEQLAVDDGALGKGCEFSQTLRSAILQGVVQGMRTEHCKHFLDQLQVDSSLLGKLELEQTLARRVSDIRHRQPGLYKAELVIVLHEPTSSSPQLKIDEFFRTRQPASSKVALNYCKLYATSNLSATQFEPLLLAGGGDAETKGVLRCVCVANAHLASKWFNTHLLNQLEQQQPSPVLLILVGEMVAKLSLSASIYEQAQVRIWFDELSLDLCGRFSLLSRSLLVSASSSLVGQRLRELAEQLLLLHVVCQELAKLDRWTTKSASFDYDQLRLALDRLEGTCAEHKGECEPTAGRLRQEIAHYLEDVVYGCRLDSESDERQLASLLARFVISQDLGRVQMDRLGQLQRAGSSASPRLMEDLLR